MGNISEFSVILDIVLTSVIIYGFYYFLKGTYTATIVKGLVVSMVVYVIANIFELHTITWLFGKFFNEFPIMIVILFHQEIRHFFSNLGRNHHKTTVSNKFSSQMSFTLSELSSNNVGALILIESNMKLHDLFEKGVILNAKFSPELILSIFNKTSPLHDGAIIIKKDRIVAANVLLPAVFNDNSIGTRHGAAVSITKERDCLALIVSEETGSISYAKDGILTPIPNILIEDIIHEVIQ